MTTTWQGRRLADGSFIPGILSNLQLPPSWQFEGPAPLVNVFGGGHLNLNPNFGTGRSRRSRPIRLTRKPSTGSVNGGIWKTTNAALTSPSWTPLTDFDQSLSITRLRSVRLISTKMDIKGDFNRNDGLRRHRQFQ